MEGLREHRKPWRVLEFYSGIGGMRYSLIKAGVDAEVVEAFDINNIANDVYEHNFGHRPHQGNIQTLSAVDLDRYEADAWLLSPPCQPYTRQGLQKGSGDARASSFLKILELISESSRPPLMLFVENVVGFEVSDTHKMMKATLRENHYETQEFILSPLQFGVPYSRPRYFCLAKRKPLTFRIEQYNNQLRHAPEFILECDGSIITTCEEVYSEEYWDSLVKYCLPVKNFLETENFSGELTAQPVKEMEEESWAISDTLHDQYQVPQSLVERLGSAMDIVFPESRRCCCFTKSYFRYVKGTGSVLATISESMKDKVSSLIELHLRYFTPREVANLHSFPDDFRFPEHVSLRQRYTLLGNSLSVGVVAPLFRYLFSSPHTFP